MPATKRQMQAFMKRQRLATFCTVGPGSTPHAVPVWFSYSGGAVYVQTDRNSVKVRNLLRNPRVCIAVYDGDEAVIITGIARLLPLQQFRRRTAEHVRKYGLRLDEQGRDSMGIPLFDADMRCVVEVVLAKLRFR
jgi:nitroimidazol reductase NimA-like FMN-containing flavoprotein (pyridoxamine 5'-phosphate oxidase superfamily)